MAVYSDGNIQTDAAIGDGCDAVAGVAEFCNIPDSASGLCDRINTLIQYCEALLNFSKG
jgi:hypothetical protein